MKGILFLALLFASFGAPTVSMGQDILVEDFEGPGWGAWKVEGEAFGPGPARGTLPRQMKVTGFLGRGLANSYHGGDKSTGTLTSPPFRIRRRYLDFLIGGGAHPGKTCIELLSGGKVVRSATGPNDAPGGSERLDWRFWEVGDLAGREVRIRIADRAKGGWGHINIDQILQSDRPRLERIRPRFHFTCRRGWLNDPNGLVYYKGEYHLFFQHNPFGRHWGNMTWGHAVSTDLLHWTRLENAIRPDAMGTIFSGSAAVDRNDTTGFRRGKEKTLVALYTSAGDFAPGPRKKPRVQSLAYSNDRGRTWTKYAKNPVLGWVAGKNRDPRILWYEPGKKWVMALYLEKDRYALFDSPDLKSWKKLCDVRLKGAWECPDFFELPLDGDEKNTRWIFWGANGSYLVGRFDGKVFTPGTKVLRSHWGANFYAAQTWSDIPARDGRRIQIGWMRGGRYPGVVFNQQMSFPRELALRSTTRGPRLFFRPVREIEKIRVRKHSWRDLDLKPGMDPLAALEGDLWDLDLTLAPGGSEQAGLRIRGREITYDTKTGRLSAFGKSALLEPGGKPVRLRVLVDKTSIEIFAAGGRVTMCFCFLPDPKARPLGLFSRGGTARVRALDVWELESTLWPRVRPGK